MSRLRRALLTLLASGASDTTRPTVEITSVASGATAAAFTCTFTFSEDVTGFALGDITVGNGSAGTFNAVSDSVYTAVITPTATGNVTVDVAEGVAQDVAGNTNTAAAQFSILYVAAAAWFDFSTTTGLYQTNNTTTPVTADGQTIGYAADKSGNSGRQATQGTAGARPTYKTNIQNGLSVARFDGGDGLVTASFSLVQPALVFVVYNITTWAGLNVVIDGVPDPAKMQARAHSVDNGSIRYTAGTERTVTNGLCKAAFGLNTILYNGASSYFRKNGTQLDAGNVGTTAPNGISIGNSPYINAGITGDVGEIIVFSTVPTDAARTSIESYLSAKWSLGF